MKKWFLLIAAVMITSFASAQTVVFHENFELPSQGDSVTSSGTPSPWGINTRVYAEGARCDSNFVQASDTSYLTTSAFNCSAYPNVILKFSHICKIEILDAGEIEVSINNGPWTKLTGAHYINPGNSQFVTNGNKFNATTYTVPNAWNYAVADAKPLNSWWMPEQFDISALAANQANVRIRFLLRDGSANGANYHHGWFIDNIQVLGSVSELNPPTITYRPPVVMDTVYNTGPFDIYAWIKDQSGIDTAWMVYTVNGGANQYVPMLWVSDSTYKGTIPSYTWNTAISYYVHAEDNSLSHNAINAGARNFYIKQGPSAVIVGTGTSTGTYPFYMYWGYTRSASVYTQAEIGQYGTLLNLAWNVSATTATNDPVKVYLKTITGSTLTADTWANLISGATLVYDGTTSFSIAGWKSFNLIAPYAYSSGNLLVLCESNYGGSGISPYPYFYYTTTTNTHETFYADNTPPSTSGTVASARPNITMGFQPTNFMLDAGITQINSPIGTVIPGTNVPVSVKLKNFSVDTLTSVTIKYAVDGAFVDSLNWTGTLYAGTVLSALTIDTENFALGSHTIKVWTTRPNGGTDQNVVNDTANGTFYVCSGTLAGTYTIGSGGDFATFASALNSLVNCGISAPVVFNVITGVYPEQVLLPAIAGSSPVNTITFQSLSGNMSDVTVQFSATGAGDNYVVKLNGADYISFKDMTLQALGTTYANVVVVDNGSISNLFDGNKITAPVTTATTTPYALVYGPSGTANDSLNVFSNNILENGNYAFYMYGPSSTSLEKGLVISDNIMTNQYYRGIYLYYQNAPRIEKNSIVTNSAYTIFYGMYLGYCDNDLKVLKNTLRLPAGGYGIYDYYCDGVVGKEGLVANNMVAIAGSNSSYGITTFYSTYQNVYFNSVNVNANAAIARAMFNNYGGSVVLKNNIFAYTGSNAAGVAIYATTTTSIVYSDYNDLFSTGTNLGYWTAVRANLAAWTTASLKDTNSVSLNPFFTTPTNLHTFSMNVLDKGKPIAGITDDIDGEIRDLVMPDLGADEFELLSFDAGVDSIAAPVYSCQLTATENVTIRLKNVGLNPMSNIDVYYVINNGTPVHEVFAGPLAPGTTQLYTFTTQANLSAYGNYSIDFYIGHASDQNPLNDSIANYTFYSGWDFLANSYTQGFEPTEYYADWTTLSVNGDAYTYEIPYNSATYAHAGSYSARLNNAATNTGGDWMFSRCFPLVAGTTYKVSFWYRAYSASYPQNVALKYGTTATPAAMTNTLATLAGFSNTTHQQSTSQFVAPTSGTYYFGWHNTSPAAAYYHYIDDINISIVPNQEASLLSITEPVSGCGLTTTEDVTIHIKNNGALNIAGNLTAYYQVNGAAPVAEVIASTIVPSDTLDYTFTNKINMLVTTHDSIFNIKSWIALTGDPFQFNDTILREVKSLHTPLTPVVSNDTIIYGSQANLSAVSADTVRWYADNITTSSFYQGENYQTPVLFDTTTYYVQSETGSPNLQTIIGLGTTTTNYVPMYGFYNYSWSSSLYTASEMGFTGLIDTIGFYVNNAVTAYTIMNQSVFMKIVPNTTFTDANNPTVASMTQVFAGNITVNGPGWYKLALQTPFVYDGSGSLELAWENRDGAYLSGYPVWRYTTTSGNTAKYAYLDANFPAGAGTLTTSRPNIFFGHHEPGCSSPRVPVSAVVIIPQEDISLIEIIAPTDACTYGVENVTVMYKNNGVDTIENTFTLGYYISGNPVATSEFVNNIILPGDTLIHTFATPANMPVLSGDSVYTITAFGANPGDIYFANDTIYKTVTMSFTPPVPTVLNDTVPYGNPANLTASSPWLLSWYTLPTGGSLIDTGSIHTTPVLYGNETYYVDASSSVPGGVTAIGSGTSTQTYIPTYGFYDYGWSSQLYTSSELGFTGRIDSIGFYVGSTTSSYQMMDQRIYMTTVPNTTFTDLNNPATASMTHVFTGDITWTGPGWYKIALQTPYVYDGTGSLEIAWENWDGVYVSGYPNFRYTTTTDYKAKYDYQDGSMPTGVGSQTYSRPNIYFSHSTPGCPSPRVAVTAVVTGQPNDDAGIVDILAPVSPTSLGSHDVDVVIRNFGLDTLETATIGWTVNGVAQTPFNYVGSLLTGEKDTVTVAAYNFVYIPYPGLNEIVAWAQNPNGLVDPMPLNDTSSVTIDAHDPYNGTYYLGTATNPDFPDFTTAALALNDWGVDGPVNILVESGTYTEQVVFDTIPGASAINTITFASTTATNTDVTLQFAATLSTANYVLKLNGADYLHFEDMTIKSTTLGTYGRVVELTAGASANYFERNIIQSVVSTSSTTAGVYCAAAGLDNNNRFIGNDILNGYYGVYFYGGSSMRKQGNRFEDNNITGWYYYGVYAYYNDSVRISGNYISNGTNATTNYHIYSYYCDNGTRIERNNIVSNGSGAFYGIYAYYNNSTATGINTIANNFISQSGGSGTAYGLYLYYSNYLNVVFNSVNIHGGSTTAGRALYQTGGSSNVVIKNNNLANTMGGFAYYVGTPAAVTTSDYNNLYTNGSVLAYWNANRANLADLQAASVKDANSKSVDPGYYSISDLHTYSIDLYQTGSPVAGITTDIDGDTRNVTMPCIGADEFIPPMVDAGIISIDAPVSPVGGGSQDVYVSLRNFGLDTLTTVTIRFDVDGVLSSPYTWNGILLSGAIDANILVGSYTFPTGVATIRAWTSMPNTIVDPMTMNDTATSDVVSCGGPLAGVYTVGGATSDYLSFTEAVLALQYCGISGPVTFNVQTGAYTEQISLGLITGASNVNTITFQSASGVNTDVVLRYGAVGTADNYVVLLDSANYIHFKNITLESVTATTYGKVVVMSGGSSYNEFSGNIIRSVVSTSSSAVPVYSTSGATESFNLFQGNTIENGYYGVYFYGSSTYPKASNEFIDNVVSGYYYYGLYLYYNDTVTVTGNTITNGSNSTTNYPLYLYYCDNGAQVINNKIHGSNTGSFYGLYLYYSDGTATNPAVIANNFISEVNGTGTAYGLYIYYSNYANVVYNSVNINGGSVTGGRAIYVTGGSNITLLNNNLANTGTGYAYYIGSTSAVILSDFNNIYTPGITFGYWGAAVADLAALQLASSQDTNSISMDPVYVSNSDLHVLSPGLNALATPLAYVTTDIDGQARNATTPDIGADEYSPIPIDIAVVGFALPTTTYAAAGTSVSVRSTIRNLGSDTITSFDVFYQYNVSAPVGFAWTGTLLPGATVDHVFTVPFIALTGTLDLCSYTVLAGDGNINNDTTCILFTGVPVLVVPDSTDFEGPNYWYADGPHTLWERGIPTSTTINVAHSPVNVWKTNLDGTYAASEVEYLYTNYFDFTQVNDATLKFWHWYQTESAYDGGKIEYNISGTSTWITLGYSGDPASTNWYNGTISGSPCFMGNSAGWVLSSYNLSSIPAIVNATGPVQFRYKFFSDATDHFDGWAIDDFAITAPPLAKDAGVIAVVNPSVSTVTGSVVSLQVTLQNFGADSLMSIPVAFRINGGAITQSLWTGVLMPGATTNYTFPTTFVSPGAAYEICSFTKRQGDIYKFNDTTCVNMAVTPAGLDAGVIAMISPTPTTVAGDSIDVTVRIRNFGTTTLNSIPLGYSRNGVQLYTTTWTGALDGGDSVDFTFPQKYVSPMAFYSLCAYSMLPSDANAANDQECIYPEGVIGMDEYGFNGFLLFQNVPNPATGNTSIMYQVPQDGKVLFELHNMFGQLILSEEQQARAGQQTIELDVDPLAVGVYYYSVSYDGKQLTKKMVVR